MRSLVLGARAALRFAGVVLLPLLAALPAEAQRSIPVLRAPAAARQPRTARNLVPPQAGFINPRSGQAGADLTGGFSWSGLPGTGYRLYVGTAPGRTDLVDSGEIYETSFPAPELPEEEILYASLWTKRAGVWSFFQEVWFSLRRSCAVLSWPKHGLTGYDESRGFEWAHVTGATRYSLQVGSRLGGKDLLSTGPISATSWHPVALPPGQLLYARLWTERDGTWCYRDAVFTPGPGPAFELLKPFGSGLREIRAGQPFEWRPFDLADAYRLEIGSRPGSNDLHDSGPIRSTRRFAEALPRGRTLYGRVSRLQRGLWIKYDFSFQVQLRDDPVAGIDAAFAEVVRVREMADDAGVPSERSPLYRYSRGLNAGCVGYSKTLLALIDDLNAGLSARFVNTCLNPNQFDCHTLVEIYDPPQNRWLLADPTFGLTVRLSDGRWATANDIANATKSLSWSALRFEYLGPRGDSLVRAYYIDYPLLFLNLYPPYTNTPNFLTRVFSPLPYYEELTGLPKEAGVYAVQAWGVREVELKKDGVVVRFRTGIDGLTPIFDAKSFSATAATPASLRVYRPRRFLF